MDFHVALAPIVNLGHASTMPAIRAMLTFPVGRVVSVIRRLRWERMLKAGFGEVESYNSYWDVEGKTFEDPDRYRVVLANCPWDK